MVIERSALAPTVVVAVPLSSPGLGSLVAEEAVAVFVITVPAMTEPSTATTSVNAALPTPSEEAEQETAPPEPTAGVVQDQPPGLASETKVVPAGSVSASEADAALLGPALVTVIE